MTRRRWLLLAAAAAAVLFTVLFYAAVRRDFLHWSGSDNVSGPEYGFWSGFAGDITILIAFGGGLTALARKINCHEVGCWRIGKFPVEGTPYTTCRFHHPTVPTDKHARRGPDSHILAAHRAHLERQAGRAANGPAKKTAKR
jgi:hypothetical protein